MEFMPGGKVVTERIDLDTRTLRHLNENLLLFFTGVTRKANGILSEQKNNIQDRLAILSEMKQIAGVARDELKKSNIDALGPLLHDSWQLKKQLASRISNGTLNDMYEAARLAGATGGKISGAGGGGFLLLYCPRGKQEAVRDALVDLQELPFKLGQDGSKVIFDYQR